jgi:hypothetical protein
MMGGSSGELLVLCSAEAQLWLLPQMDTIPVLVLADHAVTAPVTNWGVVDSQQVCHNLGTPYWTCQFAETVLTVSQI